MWLSNFLTNFTTLTSTYILVAFTFEVYLAIVHAGLHKRAVNRRVVFATVTLAWNLSIIYQVTNYVYSAEIVNGLCYPAYNLPAFALASGTYLYNVVKKEYPTGPAKGLSSNCFVSVHFVFPLWYTGDIVCMLIILIQSTNVFICNKYFTLVIVHLYQFYLCRIG